MSAVTIRLSATTCEAVEAAIGELDAALGAGIMRTKAKQEQDGQWRAYGVLTVDTPADDERRMALHRYMERFKELNGGETIE